MHHRTVSLGNHRVFTDCHSPSVRVAPRPPGLCGSEDGLPCSHVGYTAGEGQVWAGPRALAAAPA